MIRVKSRIIAYSDYDNSMFDPAYNRISEEELKDYMRNNPSPKLLEFQVNENCYSQDDLKADLLHSSDGLSFPDCISKEAMDYIEDLLNYFF